MSDMGKTLPETNIAPETMFFFGKEKLCLTQHASLSELKPSQNSNCVMRV